ncbi:MAG: hypothetical protein QT08_C0018G0008 [archaeon GW2011_AR17]|nr:MAG: hypothetical protein QT08_C0018G0008 [archaeon GW2011_AR17]MBS3154439.1 hypothetical protein [Candidatus Woesearchaeota archaeon]HIH15685.1 hypothetical protein [Nanoarchaeota archaeon]HIH59340.1 hypothetical protein [Nanoarchaeota archaeon]HII13582.1 hypothetical protein [Nanoarchaeota archaeon]
MADPTKTGLTLVGNGEEFKRLFENLNPEDRVAFLEALQHQMIQKELEDRREQIGEEGYGTLLERYGRADMEHMLAQKPWLYRNVGITALARRTKTNDQERPEVLRRVREILTNIHRGTLNYTEDFLYESTGEYDQGSIGTRVIGYRGPKSLKGIGAMLGGMFGQDQYPEGFPRTKVTEFQFMDFPSREGPTGRRLLSMVFHLGSYGARGIYWHRTNRTLAYFTGDTPKTRIKGESLESALSKMLEIDHIASPVVIQAIATLPTSIERYFKEKSEQYRTYTETLRKE